jgi:hypothetical protein
MMPALVIGFCRSAVAAGWRPWQIIERALRLLEHLHRAAEPGHPDLSPEFYKYPPV